MSACFVFTACSVCIFHLWLLLDLRASSHTLPFLVSGSRPSLLAGRPRGLRTSLSFPNPVLGWWLTRLGLGFPHVFSTSVRASCLRAYPSLAGSRRLLRAGPPDPGSKPSGLAFTLRPPAVTRVAWFQVPCISASSCLTVSGCTLFTVGAPSPAPGLRQGPCTQSPAVCEAQVPAPRSSIPTHTSASPLLPSGGEPHMLLTVK